MDLTLPGAEFTAGSHDLNRLTRKASAKPLFQYKPASANTIFQYKPVHNCQAA